MRGGQALAEDGRNVGNWVAALEHAGIAKVERDGRKMRVELLGGHMAAAMAPEGGGAGTPAVAPAPAIDGRRKDILDLMDRAESMGGEAEVRIVVRAK